jgi:hypothetical protein
MQPNPGSHEELIFDGLDIMFTLLFTFELVFNAFSNWFESKPLNTQHTQHPTPNSKPLSRFTFELVFNALFKLDRIKTFSLNPLNPLNPKP